MEIEREYIATVKLYHKDTPGLFCTIEYTTLLAMSKQYVEADRMEKLSEEPRPGYIKYAAELPVSLNMDMSQEALTAVGSILSEAFGSTGDDISSPVGNIIKELSPDDRVVCVEVLHWLDLKAPWNQQVSKVVSVMYDSIVCRITRGNGVSNVDLSSDLWCGALRTEGKRAKLSDSGLQVVCVRRCTSSRAYSSYVVSNADAQLLRESIVDVVVKRARQMNRYGEVVTPSMEVLANFMARNANYLLATYESTVRYTQAVKESNLYTHANNLMLMAVRGLVCNGPTGARFTPTGSRFATGTGAMVITVSAPDGLCVDVYYTEQDAVINQLSTDADDYDAEA